MNATRAALAAECTRSAQLEGHLHTWKQRAYDAEREAAEAKEALRVVKEAMGVLQRRLKRARDALHDTDP